MIDTPFQLSGVNILQPFLFKTGDMIDRDLHVAKTRGDKLYPAGMIRDIADGIDPVEVCPQVAVRTNRPFSNFKTGFLDKPELGSKPDASENAISFQLSRPTPLGIRDLDSINFIRTKYAGELGVGEDFACRFLESDQRSLEAHELG